jgi:hypothetical protein
MPRGAKRQVGTVRIALNGYRYIQTESGQRLLHHVLAEKKLGRPLRPDERVYFMDGDRQNVEVDNIEVRSSPRHLNQVYLLLQRAIKLEEEASSLRNQLQEILENAYVAKGEGEPSTTIRERER